MGQIGASVEVREKSIRLKFVLDGVTHKPTLKMNGRPMAPTPANEKYARRLAVEIGDKLRHGVFSMAEYFPASGNQAGVLSVAAQLQTWLDVQKIEPSTKAAYSSAVRFWKSTIGEIPLRGLKHSDILKALSTRPRLSGKTVNNYVDVLRQGVQLAVLDKVLVDNPVSGIERASHQKPPVDPFSRDEVERILEYMGKHYPEQVVNYTEFKFFTGLRTSESFGLQWQKVDLAGEYAQISEANVAGIQKNRTKTSYSRDVRLNSRALAAITRQRKFTQVAGLNVFEDPRYGMPWVDERAYRRSYWTPCLKALGIRYRVPYTTRHTYATMMLMAGLRPAFCAKQMGHSREVFDRNYALWIDGDRDDREMSLLEDSLKVPGKSLKTVN